MVQSRKRAKRGEAPAHAATGEGATTSREPEHYGHPLAAREAYSILNDLIPPLRKGEITVLDQVMSPATAEAYKTSVALFLRDFEAGEPGAERLVELLPCPAYPQVRERSAELEDAFTRFIAKNMDDKARTLVLTQGGDSGASILRNLPGRMEVTAPVEPARVPADYHVEALRGAQGLRVTKAMPVFQIVCMHRGYMCFLYEYEETVKWQPLAGWRGSRLEWAVEADSYTVDVEQFDPHARGIVQQTSVAGRPRDPRKYGLMSSGLMYGNVASLINDGTPGGEACKMTVVTFRVGYWAFPVLITIGAHQPGEWAHYDYGTGYWDLHRDNQLILQTHRDLLAAERRAERERAQQELARAVAAMQEEAEAARRQLAEREAQLQAELEAERARTNEAKAQNKKLRRLVKYLHEQREEEDDGAAAATDAQPEAVSGGPSVQPEAVAVPDGGDGGSDQGGPGAGPAGGGASAEQPAPALERVLEDAPAREPPPMQPERVTGPSGAAGAAAVKPAAAVGQQEYSKTVMLQRVAKLLAEGDLPAIKTVVLEVLGPDLMAPDPGICSGGSGSRQRSDADLLARLQPSEEQQALLAELGSLRGRIEAWQGYLTRSQLRPADKKQHFLAWQARLREAELLKFKVYLAAAAGYGSGGPVPGWDAVREQAVELATRVAGSEARLRARGSPAAEATRIARRTPGSLGMEPPRAAGQSPTPTAAGSPPGHHQAATGGIAGPQPSGWSPALQRVVGLLQPGSSSVPAAALQREKHAHAGGVNNRPPGGLQAAQMPPQGVGSSPLGSHHAMSNTARLSNRHDSHISEPAAVLDSRPAPVPSPAKLGASAGGAVPGAMTASSVEAAARELVASPEVATQELARQQRLCLAVLRAYNWTAQKEMVWCSPRRGHGQETDPDTKSAAFLRGRGTEPRDMFVLCKCAQHGASILDRFLTLEQFVEHSLGVNSSGQPRQPLELVRVSLPGGSQSLASWLASCGRSVDFPRQPLDCRVYDAAMPDRSSSVAMGTWVTARITGLDAESGRHWVLLAGSKQHSQLWLAAEYVHVGPPPPPFGPEQRPSLYDAWELHSAALGRRGGGGVADGVLAEVKAQAEKLEELPAPQCQHTPAPAAPQHAAPSPANTAQPFLEQRLDASRRASHDERNSAAGAAEAAERPNEPKEAAAPAVAQVQPQAARRRGWGHALRVSGGLLQQQPGSAKRKLDSLLGDDSSDPPTSTAPSEPQPPPSSRQRSQAGAAPGGMDAASRMGGAGECPAQRVSGGSSARSTADVSPVLSNSEQGAAGQSPTEHDAGTADAAVPDERATREGAQDGRTSDAAEDIHIRSAASAEDIHIPSAAEVVSGNPPGHTAGRTSHKPFEALQPGREAELNSAADAAAVLVDDKNGTCPVEREATAAASSPSLGVKREPNALSEAQRQPEQPCSSSSAERSIDLVVDNSTESSMDEGAESTAAFVHRFADAGTEDNPIELD